MNKIIHLATPKTDAAIKESIKKIVDQLEQFNYANTDNGMATRSIGKCIPKVYKTNNIIRIKGGMITIHPLYYIERKDLFSIRIRIKKEQS